MATFVDSPGAARSAAHHFLSAVFVTVYGYSVCNFINGLEVSLWAATLVPVLIGQWVLRSLIARRVSSASPDRRPRLAFFGELSVFVIGGSIVGIINTLFHGFPPGSGLKAMLGFVTIGLFAGLDQGFVRTRLRFEEGGMRSFSTAPRAPFAVRLGLSFGLVMALVLGVISLLVLRGIEDGAVQDVNGFRRLIVEFAFVFAIILCYVANCARQVEKLLAKAVSEQVVTLGEARDGRIRRRAVIGTHDEIGFVSAEINRLLDELERAQATTTRTNDAIMQALIGLTGHATMRPAAISSAPSIMSASSATSWPWIRTMRRRLPHRRSKTSSRRRHSMTSAKSRCLTRSSASLDASRPKSSR